MSLAEGKSEWREMAKNVVSEDRKCGLRARAAVTTERTHNPWNRGRSETEQEGGREGKPRRQGKGALGGARGREGEGAEEKHVVPTYLKVQRL